MPICQYCNQEATHVKGDKIYPHRKDLYHLSFWYCDNGHSPAYVGCHPGGDKPLGILADADLREAKKTAHLAFDPIWRNKRYTRSAAYKWLASALDISPELCHIGMFDITTCRAVVVLSHDLRRSWEPKLQQAAEDRMISFANSRRK